MRPQYLLLRTATSLRRRIRASEAWFLGLALVVGIVAGLAAIAMDQLAHGLQRLLFGLAPGEQLSGVEHVRLVALLALPLGGALVGLATWAARGRTPIDVVEANALHGGHIPARDTANVVGQTLLSNGFGASVGLEAAYAQAGGGIASLLGRRMKLRRNDLRTLVGAGAGAAISAVLGAPLTGAFYAFEIVLGAYTPASIAPVMTASIVAAVTARSMGIAPYVIAAGGMHPLGTIDYLLYVLLGIVCAGVGIVLMRFVSLVEQGVRRSGLAEPVRPVVGGVILIGLALVSPQALSSGHGAMHLNLTTEVTIASLALVLLLKIAASSVSLGFGFRGGLFFASLFIGSLLGRLYELVLGQIPGAHVLAPDDAALVGMAGLAVAVVGGPMTMALLVLEATHDFALTGVAITAALVSSSVVRETFGYSFSTWRLHLRGETLLSGRDIGWVRALTAAKMMRRDVPCIPAATPIGAFRARYPLGSVTRVVLTDAAGAYAGIVQTASAYTGDAPAEDPVDTLAQLQGAALGRDMDIAQVMQVFDRHEADDLAVLGPDRCVIGMLTERHVRKRYAEELERHQRELYGEV